MNKEFLVIVTKRFLKGLLAAVGAVALQFTLTHIPALIDVLPQLITSKTLLVVVMAALLALDKYLQGYRIQ